ncbi:MAG: tRNA-uridine aminocarboxypropyltransferase, partial [Verrucomicrobiota bacterium]
RGMRCTRCFWPEAHCWCGRITPMATATRFVFLMHPKEYRHEKAGTGRLTHLCLANSEIVVGIEFDGHPRLRELSADPANHVVLLYPGADAVNLSTDDAPPAPDGRRLVVLLLDATWACARKMLKLSPSLQRLPRVMFTPTAPSTFVIKQQPQAGCLSTLEATHQLLEVMAARGFDDYPLPRQLPALFEQMQAFQLACAADPERPGYRRRPYQTPEERRPIQGRNRRRRRFLPTPPAPDVTTG